LVQHLDLEKNRFGSCKNKGSWWELPEKKTTVVGIFIILTAKNPNMYHYRTFIALILIGLFVPVSAWAQTHLFHPILAHNPSNRQNLNIYTPYLNFRQQKCGFDKKMTAQCIFFCVYGFD